MNPRPAVIHALKADCENLLKKIHSSKPNALEFKAALSTFTNVLKKPHVDLLSNDLKQNAHLFIECMTTLQKKNDDEFKQLINPMFVSVQELKKACDDAKKQQEILEGYLESYKIIENEITQELKQDTDISQQIILLNKIEEYCQILTSHSNQFMDTNKKIIDGKLPIFRTRFNELKKKIEQNIQTLIQEIINDMGDLNSITKGIHINPKNGYYGTDDLNTWIIEYKKPAVRLKKNVDLISQIDKTAYQMLSPESRLAIDDYLKIKDELTSLIDKAQLAILEKFQAMDARIKNDLQKDNIRITSLITLLNYIRQCQVLLATLGISGVTSNQESINDVIKNFDSYIVELISTINRKLDQLLLDKKNIKDALEQLKSETEKICFDKDAQKNLIHLLKNNETLVNACKFFDLILQIENLKHIKLSKKIKTKINELLVFKEENNIPGLINDVEAIISKKYQAIQNGIQEKLNEEAPINEQIELLNYINLCESTITSNYSKLALPKSSSSQDSNVITTLINSIMQSNLNQTIKDTLCYLESAKKKAELNIENLILKMTKNTWDLDQSYENKVRPVIHVLPMDPNQRVDESADLHKSYAKSFENASNTVSGYLESIALIKNLNSENLSEKNNGYTKRLLSLEEEILNIQKKKNSIITNHLDVQVRVNDYFLSLKTKYENCLSELKAINDENISVGSNNPAWDDSVFSLKGKLYAAVYAKSHIENSLLPKLTKLNKELTEINKGANLNSFKYSDGRQEPVFSDELKKEFEGLGNQVVISNSSVMIEMSNLEQKLNKKIVEVTNIKAALETQELHLIQRKYFRKVEGKVFKDIQEWILGNEHYKALIQHEPKDKLKRENIKDFQYGIENANNLAQLANFLWPSFKYIENDTPNFNYFINSEGNKKYHTWFDSNLRRTTSILGCYTFFSNEGYQSTTDKHLSRLQVAFINHMQEKYGANDADVTLGNNADAQVLPLSSLLTDLKR